MSFFQAFADLLDSIFRSSSPEVQKKLKIRKIEAELRNHPDGIYKSELVQPNFAEALRILYNNVRPVAQILDNTICSSDIKRNQRFESELVITGYNESLKAMLDSLSYDVRKEAVTESNFPGKVYDDQKRRLEKLIQELNTKEFIKLDMVLSKLHQLSDLCRFNYATLLNLFDGDFNLLDQESRPAEFQPIPPATLEPSLVDLYYIISNFSINMSVANAIIALHQLLHGKEPSVEERKQIFSNLRKIESIAKNIINENVLLNLIRIAKNEPEALPQKASYKVNARKEFAQKLQEKFMADETKIKNELKDERISAELGQLFPNITMEDLKGYNPSIASELSLHSSNTFIWITPLRVIKTFLKHYYTEGIRSVLNDIVVEGFFSNPTYKTQFSANVFAVNECPDMIAAFENSFDQNAEYDEAKIRGLIADSHKDAGFSKKLVSFVDNINMSAKQIIQKEVSALFTLYKEVGDLIQDSKKPACEVVSNLKVIMLSSRNRESTMTLENQYSLWGIFFEIMKNYAIIDK